MWALKNNTPFEAERNWIRDKDGMHWWIVAVRATYDIAPDGSIKLSEKQLPPILAPEYFGACGTSSLKYDSDLLYIKPNTDVLVHAHAYAPEGKKVTMVPVALCFEKVEKQLIVHGERWYKGGLGGVHMTKPEPFLKCPIMYEFAYGGSDFSDEDPKKHRMDEYNPVGKGVASKAERLVDTPAYTIEYTSGNPKSKGPAGFGPIDSSWLPRRKLAGTYDDKWTKSRKPLLPEDYQETFALSAPEDQRPEKPLVGGEQITLYNMTPEGQLTIELPKIELECTTHIRKRKVNHEPPRLITVLIEPEEKRLSLTWQTSLKVAAPESDYLDQTEISEKKNTEDDDELEED
jgi:hypothetical protein